MVNWFKKNNYQKAILNIQQVQTKVQSEHLNLNHGLLLIHDVFNNYHFGYLYEDVMRSVRLGHHVDFNDFMVVVNHSLALLKYIDKGWY